MPLLLEAYQLWAELEEIAGEQLYVQTGLLQAGPADGVVVRECCAALLSTICLSIDSPQRKPCSDFRCSRYRRNTWLRLNIARVICLWRDVWLRI